MVTLSRNILHTCELELVLMQNEQLETVQPGKIVLCRQK